MSTWDHMYRKRDIDNYIVIFHLFFKIARENADYTKDANAKDALV